MAKSSGSSTNDQLINLQAQQLAAQVANWAAQLDFQKARFTQLELPEWQQKSQLEVDQFAWQKAQDTWENAYKEALITGTYQGQPTIDWLTRQAQLTGVLGPHETLQGRLADAQVSQMNQQMKLANDQFLANTTGYINGVPTFDRQQWMASTTGYVNTPTPLTPEEQARYQTLKQQAYGAPWTPDDQVRYTELQEAINGRNTMGYPQTRQDLFDLQALEQKRTGQPTPEVLAELSQLEGKMNGTVGGTQTKTFAREQWEAAQAMAGWQFMATLSGPQNAFKQARAIATMPGGLSQMMDAFAGTYMLPGSTAVGSGGQASLTDMMAGAAGNTLTNPLAASGSSYDYAQQPQPGAYTPATAPPAAVQPTPQLATPFAATPNVATGPAYTYSPPGVQAPPQAWNYTTLPSGSVQVHPPGVASPPETEDFSTSVPLQPGQAAQIAGGAYQYGGSTPTAPAAATTTGVGVPQVGLSNPTALLPNQINAENYRNMYDYQKQLGWAAFEDAGWDKGLAQDAFKKSLPTYVNPTQGKISAF